MTERRLWVGALVALVAFVSLILVVGNLGVPRQGIDPVRVEEVLAAERLSERWGSDEISIVGWYAELDADCEGDAGGADDAVAWLQRDCPLRVLLPEQPAEGVTQAQLEARGIRLTAPPDRRQPFPARAQPGGPNLRGVQLVFEGHFDDPAAERCVPERVERCRSTFVVSDYDELVR